MEVIRLLYLKGKAFYPGWRKEKFIHLPIIDASVTLNVNCSSHKFYLWEILISIFSLILF